MQHVEIAAFIKEAFEKRFIQSILEDLHHLLVVCIQLHTA